MKHRSALGVWLLICITFGIYGLYLYDTINRDLAQRLGKRTTATYRWWSQLVPFWGIVGLHKTAQRINEFQLGKAISPTATWLWWSWFFVGSWTYLQVGVNRMTIKTVWR